MVIKSRTWQRLIPIVQVDGRGLGHSPLVRDATRAYLQTTALPPRRSGTRRRGSQMESASVPTPTPSTRAVATPTPSSGDKGLKKNAIGFVSSVVIGVASTAPGYSLAATLGFIAAAVALQSPDPADRLHPDVPGRCRLVLHEQGRPGLRPQLLLGDQGHGPPAGLDRGLDDRRRRRDRDGKPGADRRPLHVPAFRLELCRCIDRG